MKPLTVITVSLLIFLAFSTFASMAERKKQAPVSPSATYAVAISPPSYANDNESVTHKNLIDCLIHYESSGNPRAIGDNGLAYGVLQFHWMTFEGYKKGLGLDHLEYWDPDDQVKLADAMLKADFGNLRHWTTRHKCL